MLTRPACRNGYTTAASTSVGYRIVKSYYQNATDKRKAIADILTRRRQGIPLGGRAAQRESGKRHSATGTSTVNEGSKPGLGSIGT